MLYLFIYFSLQIWLLEVNPLGSYVRIFSSDLYERLISEGSLTCGLAVETGAERNGEDGIPESEQTKLVSRIKH